jgi:hypothetical protein
LVSLLSKPAVTPSVGRDEWYSVVRESGDDLDIAPLSVADSRSVARWVAVVGIMNTERKPISLTAADWAWRTAFQTVLSADAPS